MSLFLSVLTCLWIMVEIPIFAMEIHELSEFGLQYQSNIDILKYENILVIGDIECNTLQIIKILQKLRICDEDKKWIANNTILIQTGNIISKHFTLSCIQTIELFIKFHHEAPKYNSLSLGILGRNELYHLHKQITGGYLSKYSLDSSLSSIKTMDTSKSSIISRLDTYRTFTTDTNYILSNHHQIGQYLRSLPLARNVGKSIFMNDIKIMIFDNDYHSSHNAYSVQYLNSKIRLYLDREFGDGPLFKKLFHPSSEFEIIPNCRVIERILNFHHVDRIINGGNIHFDIEKSYECDGKLISVNCGILSGGFGAIQIDINSDDLYVHTIINKQYVKMRLETDTLFQLFSIDQYEPRSSNKFSDVSLEIGSKHYLHQVLSSMSLSSAVQDGPYASLRE